MSTCQHGYTSFFDCPECECPGCGKAQADCTCHLDEAAAPAIVPPTIDEVRDAMARLAAAGTVRTVLKLGAGECDAELEAQNKERLRLAQRKSRARRKGADDAAR